MEEDDLRLSPVARKKEQLPWRESAYDEHLLVKLSDCPDPDPVQTRYILALGRPGAAAHSLIHLGIYRGCLGASALGPSGSPNPLVHQSLPDQPPLDPSPQMKAKLPAGKWNISDCSYPTLRTQTRLPSTSYYKDVYSSVPTATLTFYAVVKMSLSIPNAPNANLFKGGYNK